jgi:hypothetical protein
MSNEVHIQELSGKMLYFVRFNSSGQVALSDGSSFENWGASSHDADDYDVALTEIGTGGGHYVGSFDAASNISAGRYIVVVFLRISSVPEDGDIVLGANEIVWTGTGELTADKILANKAVQTKSTGAIVFYDDDGTTPILTITPTDGESTITRTPS